MVPVKFMNIFVIGNDFFDKESYQVWSNLLRILQVNNSRNFLLATTSEKSYDIPDLEQEETYAEIFNVRDSSTIEK